MKVKPTYKELENRIKELESSQYKPDIILNDFEKQNRIWIQNSPVCTKIVDLDFNLQFMSEAGVKGLQIENIEEHYGQPYPLNFFPDSFKTHMAKNLKKVKELGVITREAEILNINGQKIWFHSTIVPVYDEKGQPDYYLVISVDITEQKKIEENLRKSEERLSQVIANSGDWVWEVDTNGLYTYISESVEHALGYEAHEIVNKKHFYDFFHELNNEDLKKHNFEKMIQKKSFRNAENINVAKNGDLVWISTSGFPILGKNGDLIGYRGADKDITEKKKAEEEKGKRADELVIAKEEKGKLADELVIAKEEKGKLADELVIADEKLLKYHNHLEELVTQRTLELEEEIKKLDTAVKVFVGREQKIKQLVETVKTLEDKIKNG